MYASIYVMSQTHEFEKYQGPGGLTPSVGSVYAAKFWADALVQKDSVTSSVAMTRDLIAVASRLHVAVEPRMRPPQKVLLSLVHYHRCPLTIDDNEVRSLSG